MKRVKIGVGFGLWRLGMPSVATMVRVASRAEEWGVDSFWLTDHLNSPAPELDVIPTLAMLAAHTSKMKLGPSVLLLNLRHPLMVAKAFASLDYISGGRMVMAVGTGANLADYRACGVSTTSRGLRLDEGIEVLRTVWTDRNANYHGRFFDFDGVTIEPRPAPRGRNDFGTIDIWVGGRAEAALRRTAKLADGYFASFQTPDEFAGRIAAIRRYAAEYGRSGGHIESGIILLCRIAPSRQRALEEMRPMLESLGPRRDQFLERTAFGSPQDVIERLDEYVARGLDKFVLFPVGDAESWPHQVELIGREIASHYAQAA